MSFKVVNWIMEQDVTDHACGRLMMVLGTHADDAGHCYPRISIIAGECSMSVRTVHRVLARIKERYSHLLTWEAQNGSSNVYQFSCPDFRSSIVSSSANMVAEGSANPQAQTSQKGLRQQLADPPLPIRWQNKNRHLTINSLKQRDRDPVPRARSWPKGSGSKDRGTIEKQIADRIGPNGFEVLMQLEAERVDMLCALQRSGRLHDRDIAALRSSAAGKGGR